MKLRGLIGPWWVSRSLRRRESIETRVLSIIGLPIIHTVYSFLYFNRIKRKVAVGLSGLYEISIETYNVCNLKCVMCPYTQMTREKVFMSMGLFKKIIDDSVSIGIRRVCLNFYNEPFLDPLLFDRIKYAKSKGLYVYFYSNGSLLTHKKIADVLESELDCILFSVHAITQETYQKVMGKGDLEKTKNNILELKGERDRSGLHSPLIGVSAVVQRDNYLEEKEFYCFWKGLAEWTRLVKCDARKVAGLSPWDGKLKSKHLYPCPDVFDGIFVMGDGKIALCCYDYDGTVILGDLSKETITEAWNSQKYQEIREIHIKGQGNRIKLCRDINCSRIHREGAYRWWL